LEEGESVGGGVFAPPSFSPNASPNNQSAQSGSIHSIHSMHFSILIFILKILSQHTATGHPHSRLQENSPRSQGSVLHHANLKFCCFTYQNFAEKRCLFSPFSS